MRAERDGYRRVVKHLRQAEEAAKQAAAAGIPQWIEISVRDYRAAWRALEAAVRELDQVAELPGPVKDYIAAEQKVITARAGVRDTGARLALAVADWLGPVLEDRR